VNTLQEQSCVPASLLLLLLVLSAREASRTSSIWESMRFSTIMFMSAALLRSSTGLEAIVAAAGGVAAARAARAPGDAVFVRVLAASTKATSD
jgi:hypothetical protein